MFKTLTKLLISDFKKVTLYGDAHAISETEMVYYFRGQAIKVKILGMWITYTYYTVN